MTGDSTVLAEPEVRAVLDGLARSIEPWRHPRWDLYGTFLLPTDDPTDFAYTTTGNALVAAAFEALAALDDLVTADRSVDAPAAGLDPDDRQQAPADRASAIRAAMAERLTVEVPGGRMWAWACDESGRTECRDEPPLGLRTLPFWGVGANDDPVQRATRSWLSEDNPHHYQGTFGGFGFSPLPPPLRLRPGQPAPRPRPGRWRTARPTGRGTHGPGLGLRVLGRGHRTGPHRGSHGQHGRPAGLDGLGAPVRTGPLGPAPAPMSPNRRP